jgi:PAS domain S-box-containing protein
LYRTQIPWIFELNIKNFADAVVEDNYSLSENILPELKPLLIKIKEHNAELKREVAERKQVEFRLKLKEKKFRKIFLLSPIGIELYDKNGLLIDTNKSCLDMFGVSNVDDLKGFNLFEDPNLPEEAKKKIINGEQTRYEVRFNFDIVREKKIYETTKSGFIYIDVLISPFGKEGDIYQGYLVQVQEITERKLAEKEMARLSQLNLIGEMAAGIAHEIRNPMTTVRGFLQMLGGKNGQERYQEYFNLMIEELDRANSIISEYLSLAKNKALELKISNLKPVIETVFPLIQADAMMNDKNIYMELQDVPDLLMDEKEIRQLLLNLVHNGLQAMTARKILTIRLCRDGNEVVLAVHDEGKGINPEILDKIGTPFFTTKDTGTGLGLATCYSIATRHNAKINIETNSEGTTFFVRFKIN